MEKEYNLFSVFLVDRRGRLGFKLREGALDLGMRKKIANIRNPVKKWNRLREGHRASVFTGVRTLICPETDLGTVNPALG